MSLSIIINVISAILFICISLFSSEHCCVLLISNAIKQHQYTACICAFRILLTAQTEDLNLINRHKYKGLCLMLFLFNFVSVFCYLFNYIGSVFVLKMAVLQLVRTPPIFCRAHHVENMR